MLLCRSWLHRCQATLTIHGRIRLTPHAHCLHSRGCAANGLYADFVVDDGQHKQMLAYLDAVLEYNKHTNLTGLAFPGIRPLRST